MKKGSPIKSFRDLRRQDRGRDRRHDQRADAARPGEPSFKLDITLRVAADHAASFELLTSGQADAFATDDVLLYGLLAQNRRQGEYVVTGEFLSYDPYGIMFRKGDAQLARVVNDTFHDLAADREIERRYNRWFLRKLPSGVSLDLPMSPQLESLIQALGARTTE